MDGLIYKYTVSESPTNRITTQAAKSVTLGEERFHKRRSRICQQKGRLVHLEKIKETKEIGNS